MHMRRSTLIISAVWLLLALMALGGAAFAWFTFGVDTNITPMASSVGRGGVDLKISDSYGGPFAAECNLTYENNADGSLYPVSTSSLEHWYEPTAQDRNGISTSFREITEQSVLDAMTWHGRVYLLSENQDCDLYLSRTDMLLTMGEGAEQAARLGLILRDETTGRELTRVMLRLDELDMERTGGAAEAVQTVTESGAVIESTDGGGYPSFTADPAEDINDYMAYASGQTELGPGRRALAMLPADTVITAEYYLYLEGCDDNCVNAIQDAEIRFNLGWAGAAVQTD